MSSNFQRAQSHSLREGESITRLSWAILLSIGFFLLLWEQAGNAAVLRTAAHTITQPSVQITVQMQSAQQRFANWWQFTWRGAEHLAQLEHEIRVGQVDQVRLQQLEEENAVLRSELNFPIDSSERVAKWYGNDQEWFINLGCEDGVESGALVTADGVFVGTVETVFSSYSEVKTWSDPSWRLAVKVGTESAYGVFSFGRSIPEVEEVPIVYKNLLGAQVRTAGQADAPPNYLLGKVQEIIEEPGFGTVRMVVDPAIDFRDIVFVRVESKGKNICLQ